MHYDSIIIGSGPGGEGAAMHLTKHGQKVAIVEKNKIGGDSTHLSTIPSKVLRHVVQKYEDYNKFFNENSILKPKITQFTKLAVEIAKKQEKLRFNFYLKNKVAVHFGMASFINSKKIEVLGERKLQLTADNFIIATGSTPYHPTEIDFKDPQIFDSNKILQIKELPFSCTIYGAGVIGCEYASILSSIGVKINLVHQRASLLSFLDEEIIHALIYNLQSKSVNIFNKEEFDYLEKKENKIILHTKTSKRIKSDILFWANGRTGNTKDLQLTNCELKSNQREMIVVNENYQTTQKHIYAVGDIIGYPSLSSTAYDQGRIAANHILHQNIGSHFQIMPTGIYTTPEISSIGKTEAELTAEKIPYEVGKAHFSSIARAQIVSQQVGMLKIIFHLDTLEILGIHCFGEQASEIIHIGQAIMSQKNGANSIMYFINTTFNYPTMAEAYRIAALNAINRL